MTSWTRIPPASAAPAYRVNAWTGDGTWQGPRDPVDLPPNLDAVRFPTIGQASAVLNQAADDLRASHPSVFEKLAGQVTAAPPAKFVKVREKLAILDRAETELEKLKKLPLLDLEHVMIILGAARFANPEVPAADFESALLAAFRAYSSPDAPVRDDAELYKEPALQDVFAALRSCDGDRLQLVEAAKTDFAIFATTTRLQTVRDFGARYLDRARLMRDRPHDYWKEMGEPLPPSALEGIVPDGRGIIDAKASEQLRRFVERHAVAQEEKLSGYASFALNDPPLAESFSGGDLAADFVAKYGETDEIMGATLIPEVGYPEKIIVIREANAIEDAEGDERVTYRVYRPMRRIERASFLSSEGIEAPTSLPGPFLGAAAFERWEAETFNGITAAASRLFQKTREAYAVDTRRLRSVLDTVGLAHDLDYPVAESFFSVFFLTLGDATNGYFIKEDFSADDRPKPRCPSPSGEIAVHFVLSNGSAEITAGTVKGEKIVLMDVGDGRHALVLKAGVKPALVNFAITPIS